MPGSPNILNVTLPLKQDFVTQTKLQELIRTFATNPKLFPAAAKALQDSKMVHYARFVLIGTQYLQILTEYDTDFGQYTAWFARNLQPFFSELFQYVEGGPPPEVVSNPDKLLAFVKALDVPCLGNIAFSAYGDAKVTEIQDALALANKTK
jgi:hypothetical protein